MISRLIVLLLLLGLPVGAATNTAASASRANVLTAYNACSDGDTLSIPSGSATWATPINVTKGIYIIGAGTNSTIITATSGQRIWEIDLASDLPVRIAHMKFIKTYDGVYTIYIAGSDVTTNSVRSQIRIDHCYFEQGQYNITYNGVGIYGVIDHCYFHNTDMGIQPLGGAYEWIVRPIAAGTTNAMYIEDCKFILDTLSADMNEQISSGHGVRFVVRFNTFDGSSYTGGTPFLPYEHHGAGGISASPPASDDLRAPPVYEIYGNTMAVYSTYRHMNIRGGMGLIFSNTMTSVVGGGGAGGINLTEDDSTTAHKTTWPSIDQIANTFFWSNTWDGVLFTSADFSYSDANDTNHIQLDRDFFMHAPTATGGIETWSDWDGSTNITFTGGVAQKFYPYTPLTYPHPLVTAQDGGGGGGGGGGTTANVGTFNKR